jgi:hypothetical protein
MGIPMGQLKKSKQPALEIKKDSYPGMPSGMPQMLR